jgi:hypothetical protein
LGGVTHMAIPGLKDFNRLVDSAQSEIDAWSKTAAAAAIPASRLAYIRDVLAAVEDSASVGSLAVGFRNVLSTVESFGIPTAQISPSLVRLSALLAEREQKDSRNL